MATVTKARPATVGTTKTATKPLGSKASATTPVTAKGNSATRGGATPAASIPRPKMGRFMMGMVAYLIGSYVIQYLVIFLDVKFKWGLEKKTVVTLPLLGPINGITLVFMLSLVGLLFALYKFRVLPSASSLRQQPATATTAAKGSIATKGTTSAKGTQAKANATVGKPTTGKLATATAGANTKGTAKKATAVVTEEAPGENDDLYHQVRSQMRAQARKRKR